MARKPNTSSERISLRDFKSWLAGVEDMQPDNWSPTPEQWKRIRDKIDAIDVVEREEAVQEKPGKGAKARAMPAPSGPTVDVERLEQLLDSTTMPSQIPPVVGADGAIIHPSTSFMPPPQYTSTGGAAPAGGPFRSGFE